MKLKINTIELLNERGVWMSSVDCFKYDGSFDKSPQKIEFGNSDKDAYNKLKKFLELNGHEVAK